MQNHGLMGPMALMRPMSPMGPIGRSSMTILLPDMTVQGPLPLHSPACGPIRPMGPTGAHMIQRDPGELAWRYPAAPRRRGAPELRGGSPQADQNPSQPFLESTKNLASGIENPGVGGNTRFGLGLGLALGP